MNLAQTLLQLGGVPSVRSGAVSLGKEAINATGIPYLINTDIINPIKSATAQLTGNKEAMRNAEKAYKRPLPTQLKDWGVNSAGALSLPFALEGAATHIWKPPVTPQGYLPFVEGPANTAARVGPNDRYTMGDVGAYKLDKNYINPKDWNGINQSARELSKKFNIDLVNGSPAEINGRIADFLDRFNGM